MMMSNEGPELPELVELTIDDLIRASLDEINVILDRMHNLVALCEKMNALKNPTPSTRSEKVATFLRDYERRKADESGQH